MLLVYKLKKNPLPLKNSKSASPTLFANIENFCQSLSPAERRAGEDTLSAGNSFTPLLIPKL